MKHSRDEYVLWGEKKIPSGFMKALGRVVVNFAHLEHVLALYCGSNLGVSYPFSEIVSADLSFKQRLNLARSIAETLSVATMDASSLKDLFGKLVSLEEERNRVVHSYFGFASRTREVVRKKVTVKSRRGHLITEEPVTSEQVDDLADRLNQAASQMGVLIFRLAEGSKRVPQLVVKRNP